MELTDLSELLTRECPNPDCGETFTLPFPLPTGRTPIYCPDCRTSHQRTRERICPWPPCRQRFTLKPTQASATSFCCEAHKAKHHALLRTFKPPTCFATGCRNPLPVPNTNRHAYCSPACATAHHAHFADTDPDRLLCKRPACTNIIPYDPSTQRRIPKFCSQLCRDAFAPTTDATPASANARRPQRRFRKVKLTGLETATPLHDPARRYPWQQLKPHLRLQYERDGWTQESWESYHGPYSPAALHWAVLQEPQHCDLTHITVQDYASTLATGSTDWWNEGD